MKKLFSILLVLISVCLYSQQNYRVIRLPFNTSNNEMAPVIYKDGIVFSCDKKDNVVKVTTDINNKYPYNLYYVEKKGKKWSRPSLFSRDINSPLSEASATFSDEQSLMYFTRNLYADQKLSDLQKLTANINYGIFQASATNKGWLVTREFPYNDDSINVVQPSLSPDGKKMFFSSTMPGGVGGYDIYSSTYENGQWQKPVNLGPIINTNENEVFPFMHQNGRLYFSSRGHSSQGGLDIFYTEIINGEWIVPINLPKPFNSRKDEFGYVLSANMDTGYFASNRLTGTDDDIYMFVSSFPMFNECKPQVNESFCYEFNETGSMNIDTTSLKYEWDFGDGNKKRAVIATHCYSKTGTYAVALNVIDTLTGDVYYSEASYNLLVQPLEQPFITSPDTIVVNDKAGFNGYKSIIRSFSANNHYWDFGDGNISTGVEAQHAYNKAGTYYVRLGITAVVDDPEADVVDYSSRACSQKQIIVVKNTVK
jgi:hypothetical protein